MGVHHCEGQTLLTLAVGYDFPNTLRYLLPVRLPALTGPDTAAFTVPVRYCKPLAETPPVHSEN